ncbi:MAG: C39 family peptidase [Myxococcales bacterium]|nr:C39 family peptidase [Myxococcales bacterium]
MTRPPRLLDVPVLRQATGYECGNTALASVMQYLGAPRSPAEIAMLARTTPDGTDHANLVAAARATGATVIEKENGTLDEIAAFVARGLPVIVGWWPLGPGDEDWQPGWSPAERRARDCGHFSVIHGITATGVVLMDPEVGSYELTFEAFDRAWYDTDTEHYVKVTRWYLVLDYAGNPLSS